MLASDIGTLPNIPQSEQMGYLQSSQKYDISILC